jgi:hypothetical protein
MSLVCNSKEEAVQALATLAEAMPRGTQRDAIDAVKEWAAQTADLMEITTMRPEERHARIEELEMKLHPECVGCKKRKAEV